MQKITFREALWELLRYAGIALLLAIAAWWGFHPRVQFLPALQIFGMIFVLKYVYDFESGAFKLVEGMANFGKKVAIGVLFFYFLWYVVVGQVLGILPVETYRLPFGPWDAMWLDQAGINALGSQVVQTAALAWISVATSAWFAFYVAKKEHYKVIAIVAVVTIAVYAVVDRMPRSASLWPGWSGFDDWYFNWATAKPTTTPMPGSAAPRMSMIPDDTAGLEAYVATRPPCSGEKEGYISHKAGDDDMVRTLGKGFGCWMRWETLRYDTTIHFEWWTEADHHFCVQIYGVPGIVKCDPTRDWSPFVAGGLRYRLIGDDWMRFEVWDNNNAGR